MSTFSDLVNIPTFWKKKEDFKKDRGEVTFYCRDCKKIVEVNRLDKNKYIYECKECKNKNISIWTKEWLIDHYERL